MQVCFVVYPSVVYAAFASFNCRTLQLLPQLKQVLLDDDRVQCEEIYAIQAASVAVIVCFACGAPVYLLWDLFRKKRRSAAEERQHLQVSLKIADMCGIDASEAEVVVHDLTLSRGVATLVDAYGFRHLYTEPLEMMRKLLLVGVSVLVGQGSVWQMVICIVSTFGFFALHLAVRPFRLWQDTFLRLLCEANMFLFVLSGLIYQLPPTENERFSAEDSSVISWVLILCLVLLIPVAFIGAIISKLDLLCELDGQMETEDSDAATHKRFQRAALGLASEKDIKRLQRILDEVRIELGWDLSAAELRTLVWIREDLGLPEDMPNLETLQVASARLQLTDDSAPQGSARVKLIADALAERAKEQAKPGLFLSHFQQYGKRACV